VVLTSRRVIVTGGASGIGLGAVRALVDNGAKVAVLDLDFANFPNDLTVPRFTADVSKEDDVAAAFTRAAAALGGIDAVIHSAGIQREQQRDLREISLQSWQKLISVNLTGAFLVAREAVRLMAPTGGGVLILVGSGAGTTGPSGSIPYGASKGGVNGLAMTLAKHLEPQHIRVHNFLPGAVDTPLIQRSFDEGLGNGADAETFAAMRSNLVDPAAIGRVLAFLVSEDGDAVKGNVATR
jgi:NAD(P)-dependent dehydrogenase (short-subunit alcohol dehydrogenase family)